MLDRVGGMPLLRHRPGHVTRMPDLASYLDANPAADPLSGNYVLVHLQDIVLNFQGLSNEFALMALSASEGSDGPTLEVTGNLLQGDNVPGKHLALATGDFDGDSLDEIASAYNDNGALTLLLARNHDPSAEDQSLEVISTTGVGHFQGGKVSICTGSFTGADAAEMCIAWVGSDNTLEVQVWGTDTELKPSLKASDAQLRVADGNELALAAGDFNQDGRSELAILWQGEADSSDNTLFLAICAADGKGGLDVLARTGVAPLGSAGQFSMATGACNGATVSEQLIVAWSDQDDRARGQVFTLDATKGLIAHGSPYIDSTYPLTDSRLVRVTTGDLDLDGVDEIVMGTVGQREGRGALVILHVLKADNLFELDMRSSGALGSSPNVAFAAVDFDLAIGQVGANGFHGIVVAALGGAGFNVLRGVAQLSVGFVEVSPELSLPPALVNGVGSLTGEQTFNNAQGPNLDINLGMALGDFSGKSIRVGNVKSYSFDHANSVIAIINAPPTQDGVNFDGSSTLTFNNSEQQTTSLGVTVTRDWTHSDELGAHLSVGSIASINESLTRTYGENFSRTNDHSNSFTQSINFNIWQDDLVVLSGTHYNVWEYDVYDDSTGKPKGQLAVIFPDVDGPETMYFYGTSQFLDYFPDHQPGVLLSYSPLDPVDYLPADAVNLPLELDIGGGNANVTVDWTHSNTTSRQRTGHSSLATSTGINFSPVQNFMGGLGIGFQAHFNGTYTETKMSTYSIMYTDSTSVSIVYAPLQDRSAEYTVHPYIYFSDDGGFLVVDYAVTVPDSGYWHAHFSQPCPTFNQPWASETDPDMREYTRSIRFVEQTDGNVSITARVSNSSFAAAEKVKVTFYVGNPQQKGAVPIGESVTISQVASRGHENVGVLWRPVGTQQQRIYASIEPDGGSAFTPSQGFGLWPPTRLPDLEPAL